MQRTLSSELRHRPSPCGGFVQLILTLLPVTPLVGQGWFSVPPRHEGVPGNSGVSMPGRWASGTMQVLLQRDILPSDLTTTPLLGLRLRRAAFPDEPSWPARSVDIEVRLASSALPTSRIAGHLPTNRQAHTLTVVVPRATVNLPPTTPLGVRDTVGPLLLDLPFTAPFTFAGPNLYVEWENFAATQNVSPYHWTDAVDVTGGDVGFTVPLGAYGCGGRSARPMLLEPVPIEAAMALGTAYPLLLRNTKPSAPGFVALRLDPERNPPLGLPMGSDLAAFGMPGCPIWAGSTGFVEGSFPAVADVNGNLRVAVTVPDLPALRGSRLGMQAFALDRAHNSLGVTSSNGLLARPNFAGVFNHAVTVLDPTAGPFSPWLPFVGYTPVFLFRR